MKSYRRIGLKQLIKLTEQSPEIMSHQKLEDIILRFSCPFKNDVENFLHEKAIEFERQGIAATHLIFTSYQEELVLVGYFTLASKYIHIEIKNNRYKLGNHLKQRIKRFGTYEPDLKKQIIPMPLIGQLGKNYASNYDKLITGDELLQLACDTVRESQALVGGKTVYLECEDTPKLVQFYESNGFKLFGKRDIEPKEGRFFTGEYLLQLLKYL